jgi:hypothetical protein
VHEILGIVDNRVDLSAVPNVRKELREIVLASHQDAFFRVGACLHLRITMCPLVVMRGAYAFICMRSFLLGPALGGIVSLLSLFASLCCCRCCFCILASHASHARRTACT